MKLQRVIVPVDFSEPSIEALNYAIDLTKAFEPEIVVVFALAPVEFATAGHAYVTAANVDRMVEDQRKFARIELDELIADVSKRGVRARGLLAEGSAHNAIVDVAEREAADLIVMSSHGRTGVSRLLMGSVAEMVTRHAPCPVVTVRHGPAEEKAKAAGGKK